MPENAEKNLPIEEVEIEPEIIEDIKEELQPTEETETREKPSEGGFFSRLVKGLLKTKQNIGAGFRSFS
ncbi:cell division protein FtsY [Rodentibacter pneumotropicus]|uniref:Cell division protein FtsY n=1 Tax=Rodentibacter pneumotropicus TaxID=758 RepID=A0A448MJX7_9PAST|nr:cell division protein FtsY [Rodentibacter pneumotropicus]